MLDSMKDTLRRRSGSRSDEHLRRSRTASKRTVAIAMGCLLAGAALAPVGAAGAGTLMSVVIGNDSSNPVPTKSVGTTKTDGTVTVVNGADRPVPVRQDTGAPYQKSLSIRVPDDRLGADALVSIPAGKDLVIDHISIQSTSKKPPYWFWVEAIAPDSFQVLGAVYLPIEAAPAADGAGFDEAAADAATSLRVPDTYQVRVRFNGVDSDASASVSIIGRLVDERAIAS